MNYSTFSVKTKAQKMEYGMIRSDDENPKLYDATHDSIRVGKTSFFCKEYLCDCGPCLKFDLKDCHKADQQELDDLTDVKVYDDENDDADRDEQIFEFVEVPSFVTLFTGSNTELLYFVQVTEKGISEKNLSDPYGHVILPGKRYFKRYYFKFSRSRSISFKQLQVLPTSIVLSPDEIYDTYVDIDEKMQLGINVCNILLQKARM